MNKNNGEDQRRQRVDETRPIVEAAIAAAYASQSHDASMPSSSPELTGDDIQQHCEFPCSAHPGHQPIPGSSVVRRACDEPAPGSLRLRFAIAVRWLARLRAVLLDHAVRRRSSESRYGSVGNALNTDPAGSMSSRTTSRHGSRKPVFKVGIKAVLCLARL